MNWIKNRTLDNNEPDTYRIVPCVFSRNNLFFILFELNTIHPLESNLFLCMDFIDWIQYDNGLNRNNCINNVCQSTGRAINARRFTQKMPHSTNRDVNICYLFNFGLKSNSVSAMSFHFELVNISFTLFLEKTSQISDWFRCFGPWSIIMFFQSDHRRRTRTFI